MRRKFFISFLVFMLSLFMFSLSLSAKSVKIGFIYILSGPFATYGDFAKKGAQLAVDEINKSGGILGNQVECIFEDSAGKPDVALRAIRKLVLQDKVDILVGLDSSGVANSVVPVIDQLKTPLIITHAASPEVTGKLCNKYTFRISVNLPQNVKAAAILASETNAKKWTTIGPGYAFGFDSWKYFKDYLKKIKPSSEFFSDEEVVFPPAKTTDFSPYITKIMNSKPDGVLISLWGGNLVDFVRQANDMGFFKQKFQVLMTLGAATEVLDALGDKMPEGIWVGTRYWFKANDSDLNKKFVDSYFKTYNKYPSYNAHGAYSAVYAFKKAAEKSKNLDKDSIVKSLEGLEVDLPLGKVTMRAEDHQAVSNATWGKTKITKDFPFAILDPVRIFPAAQVTPPVAETECKLK